MTRQIAKVLTGSMIAGAALAVKASEPDPFTRIPPFDKYDGMTRLPLDDGGLIVCMGVGEVVEAALREAARERGRHG